MHHIINQFVFICHSKLPPSSLLLLSQVFSKSIALNPIPTGYCHVIYNEKDAVRNSCPHSICFWQQDLNLGHLV